MLEEAAVRLARDLVRIDSRSASLVPSGPGEGPIVDHLARRLRRAGFRTTVVESTVAGRPSLVALSPSATDARVVMLNGHLDTVGVDGMVDPFAGRIDGDRLLGRGSADMKGGVAALVVVAEHLAHRPVALALVADEEDASLGSEAVIDALPTLGIRPRVCLIAEPTDLVPTRSLRGFVLMRVRFDGLAAHSSQREQGVDAIAHLGRFLAAVDERAVSVRAGGGELMVTSVQGGTSPFVVADRAECLVERRIVPGESTEGVVEEVRALLDPSWRAEVRVVQAREPWRLDAQGPAAELASELGSALGTEPEFDAPYWMEAPLWQRVCPTVTCGPSGGGLHAVDEWVDLRQVRAFTRAVADVLSGETVAASTVET